MSVSFHDVMTSQDTFDRKFLKRAKFNIAAILLDRQKQHFDELVT